MSKVLKPLTAVFVIAAIVASAIFCCCAGILDQAHSLKNTATSGCCDSDKSSHQNDSQTCNCSLTKFITADAQLSAVVAPSLSNAFYPHEVILAFQQTVRIASLRTDYGGAPPGPLYSVPLFLQYRSIRI